MRFCELSQRLFLAAVLGALVSVSAVGWSQDLGDSLGADADSSEMMPSISDDDNEAAETDSPAGSAGATDSDEVVPWIADEDPNDNSDPDDIDAGDSETGDTSALTPVTKTASQDLQDLAKEHWLVVASAIGALLLIPILLFLLRRRKDPVARYAAASMKAPAEHTPMAMDSDHTFTEHGTLAPIHGGTEANDVPAFEVGYGGSEVPPGAPGYPSIPTTVPPPIQTPMTSADASETEFELTDDDVEWDNVEEWADVDSPDHDIAGFEAANANDPFPNFESTEDTGLEKEVTHNSPITPIEEPAIDIDEVSITGETAVVSGNDSIGMTAALEPAEGVDVSIAEMRLIAIQEALIKEQQRVAELQQREDQLKDQLARMQTQLAASNRQSTVLGGSGSVELSPAETHAVVRLQEENQSLQIQLQSETTQRQAQQLQLQTFETSIKSLEARLKLANTERDNLAKMLYDARRAAPRPPR